MNASTSGPGNTAASDRRTNAAPSEAHRLNSLAEIARLIGSSSDLPAVLNRIVVAVCQHSSWSSCGIMGVNRKAGLSELVVRFDPRLDPATNPPTAWKLEQSATMRVVETNRPVIIDDAQVCDEFLAYKEDALLRGYRTVVILPLGDTDHLGREMTIAVHSRERIAVSESELAFLSTVTQLASIAVEKAKRVQLEQNRAQRLRETIEISTELMESVLAEGLDGAVVEMVAAVLPFPLIIADLAAGTFSVRRSPAPKLIGEAEWKRHVSQELAPAIVALLRSARRAAADRPGAGGPASNGTTTLRPVVEPLQVHNETAGRLDHLPSGRRLDDLDGMVVQAAKLALNVQVMRDHVRFRSEANSLPRCSRHCSPGRRATRRAGRPCPAPGRLTAGPARLVTIGFAARDRGRRSRRARACT